VFHYLRLMTVVTEYSKFTCFEKINLFKQCISIFFFKFSIELINLLVFARCGEFGDRVANPGGRVSFTT
jgi:hypothetical protein